MVNRKRSFFVTGALLSVLVLFGAEAAFAQVSDVEDLAASSRGHDTIRLTWTHAGGSTLEKFSLRYQQTTPADTAGVVTGDFNTSMDIMRMDIAKKSSGTEYSYILEGLKPDKDYIFGIRTLGAGTTADGTGEDYAWAKTDTADAPDDVLNLMLTAGDTMIMAMWDEATDNGSEVTGYSVGYREKGKSSWMESRDGKTGTDTSTKWTISNLKNDMTYEVRVQACSFDMCGDWTDEEEATPMSGATPTPALPIFGAFALGAGLLAAGRARLRRRDEQHQLTR